MASTKNKIVVEGIPQLVKQFPEILGDIMEAANKAAEDAMGIALSSAQQTNRFENAGRKNASKGNNTHPPGNLRSSIQLFVYRQAGIRKKLRVWVSLGVPHKKMGGVKAGGSAYYIPLNQGHKVVSHGEDTGARTQNRDFLGDAYQLAYPSAETKIIAAINRVLAKYPPETPK